MKLYLEQVLVHEVTYESMDDGHRLTDSYWSYNSNKAVERAKQLHKGAVVENVVWADNYGCYWLLERKEIFVDLPSRDEILSKIPAKMRRAYKI